MDVSIRSIKTNRVKLTVVVGTNIARKEIRELGLCERRRDPGLAAGILGQVSDLRLQR